MALTCNSPMEVEASGPIRARVSHLFSSVGLQVLSCSEVTVLGCMTHSPLPGLEDT